MSFELRRESLPAKVPFSSLKQGDFYTDSIGDLCVKGMPLKKDRSNSFCLGPSTQNRAVFYEEHPDSLVTPVKVVISY